MGKLLNRTGISRCLQSLHSGTKLGRVAFVSRFSSSLPHSLMFCGQDIVLSTAKGSDRGLIPFYGGSESGVRYLISYRTCRQSTQRSKQLMPRFYLSLQLRHLQEKALRGGRVDRFKLVDTSEERRTLIARTAMQQSSAWTNPCEKYSTCTS